MDRDPSSLLRHIITALVQRGPSPELERLAVELREVDPVQGALALSEIRFRQRRAPEAEAEIRAAIAVAGATTELGLQLACGQSRDDRLRPNKQTCGQKQARSKRDRRENLRHGIIELGKK